MPKKDHDKRPREFTLSDESLCATPTLKQPKINLFINQNNESEDEIDTSQYNLADIMKQMRKMESALKKEISAVQESMKTLTDENIALRKELINTKQTINKLETKVNDLEQYTRRNNLRVFGVPDTGVWETAEQAEEKVLNVINKKLSMADIKGNDIEIAHRVGKFQQGKNRAIIVRFLSRKIKEKVIRERRKLKGSKMLIAEDLTKENAAWFFQVKSTPGVTSTWTRNGETFISTPSGIHKVLKDTNLRNLPLLVKENPHNTSTSASTGTARSNQKYSTST